MTSRCPIPSSSLNRRAETFRGLCLMKFQAAALTQSLRQIQEACGFLFPLATQVQERPSIVHHPSVLKDAGSSVCAIQQVAVWPPKAFFHERGNDHLSQLLEIQKCSPLLKQLVGYKRFFLFGTKRYDPRERTERKHVYTNRIYKPGGGGTGL